MAQSKKKYLMGGQKQIYSEQNGKMLEDMLLSPLNIEAEVTRYVDKNMQIKTGVMQSDNTTGSWDMQHGAQNQLNKQTNCHPYLDFIRGYNVTH